jgi:hypothetical protein
MLGQCCPFDVVRFDDDDLGNDLALVGDTNEKGDVHCLWLGHSWDRTSEGQMMAGWYCEPGYLVSVIRNAKGRI